jgi:hypothetical protein
LEERKNYTYAIEITRKIIDAKDLIMDAIFWHECFCVCVATLFNV